MAGLPSGTVTLLFTDVEGSTLLLKRLGARYDEVLVGQRELLSSVLAAEGGSVVDVQGDALFVSFARAHDAVRGAIAAQRALAEHGWPDGEEVKVRMGLHTGEPERREGRYVGLDVHRAARIAAAAHGGQILVSTATRDLVEHDLPAGEQLLDLGTHRLRHLDRSEHLHQLVAPGLRKTFPPPKTLDTEEAARLRRRRRAWIGSALVGVTAAALAVPLLVFAAGGGGKGLKSIPGDAVGVVDARTGEIARAVPLAAAPGAVAAGEGTAWVVSPAEGTVARLDTRSGLVVQTIRIAGDAGAIAVGGGAGWVVSRSSATLTRIDLRTNQVVKTTVVGGGPAGIAYGNGSIWVTDAAERSVLRIDARSQRVVRRIRLSDPPIGIVTTRNAVWVSHEAAGAVTKIDAGTGDVVGTVNVGKGPSALAADGDGVWVVNSLDGTVSRLDPRTLGVRATIPVGKSPVAIVCLPGAVWVANELSGTLSRIDPRTNTVVRTIGVGGSPKGLATLGADLLVSARTVSGHRGGVLRVHELTGGIDSIDPALGYTTWSWQLSTMLGDGLVAFKHVGGPAGATLVPDLAVSLPLPVAGGRVYSFQLRSGIEYSDGRPVRARDVRTSLERVFAVGSPGAFQYAGIVGGPRCLERPKTCDLSTGVVTDDARGTVVFYLREPDPHFLYKLAIPFANVLPSDTPRRKMGTTPGVGTGPYVVAEYRPAKLLRLVRNRFFKVWSEAAKPAGYPDEIRITFVGSTPAALAQEVRLAQQGRIDLAAFVESSQRDQLRTRYASQVHEAQQAATTLILLNTTLPPFDRLAVRKALSYAVDRKAASSGLITGQPTCQFLAPGIAGYRPYCPYTLHPEAGSWSAPDLARARKLVEGTGTKGMRVTIATPIADDTAAQATVAALRKLGYRATTKLLPADRYWAALQAPAGPRTIQAASLWWVADWPAPSALLAPLFSCSSVYGKYWCDKRVEDALAKARTEEVADPASAERLWRAIDRMVVDRALGVAEFNLAKFDFVSRRFGNYQGHLEYGLLLDQAWVR